MSAKYDWIIVGAGLYGASFAYCAKLAGKKCLILEKRNHIAGNAYTKQMEGIEVHCYGAHIFHTNSRRVWSFVNRFAEFNRFTNSPIANYRGEIYNLPFNMNTFHQMWGVVTPEQAKAYLNRQRAPYFVESPRNLEEQALNLVGRDIYEKLIRGYTEKQWGRPCTELPPSIIRRIPVRYTYDNNYFDAAYQGIPKEGYTALVARMLEGTQVRLGVDYLQDQSFWDRQAKRILYTGQIDAYFSYALGPLAYRSLRFETEVLAQPDFQGNAVVNYTDREPLYTRVIEHQHFVGGQKRGKTVITREYSREWNVKEEPYYPIRNAENCRLYEQYAMLAARQEQVVFGGRLGSYQYFDMDQTIEKALDCAAAVFGTA